MYSSTPFIWYATCLPYQTLGFFTGWPHPALGYFRLSKRSLEFFKIHMWFMPLRESSGAMSPMNGGAGYSARKHHVSRKTRRILVYIFHLIYDMLTIPKHMLFAHNDQTQPFRKGPNIWDHKCTRRHLLFDMQDMPPTSDLFFFFFLSNFVKC
jgi:hypothetical protein